MNNTVIPQSSTAKYLGFHLDSMLIWEQHTAKKAGRCKGKIYVLDHWTNIHHIARW
jgi:hypothetical protein